VSPTTLADVPGVRESLSAEACPFRPLNARDTSADRIREIGRADNRSEMRWHVSYEYLRRGRRKRGDASVANQTTDEVVAWRLPDSEIAV